MTRSQRLMLPVTVLLLLLAPLTGAFAADSACEGCGLTHDNQVHGGPITLTDWQTNHSYTYQSLACAVDAMRADYPWSRARWTGPDGRDFTLTRAEGRWDASPAEAIALIVQGDRCQSVVALASRDELEPWLKRHGNPAHSQPIALASLGEANPAAPSIDSFADVPADHWASEAVEVSADAGLLTGDPDGNFHGQRDVTRYEMAIILQRLLQRIDAASAGEAGLALVSGIRAELARTGASEAEVAEIVQIAADPDVPTPPAVRAGAAQWPDVPAGHWAADAVQFATETGFMNGYPDGRFRGGESLSRYEIAVILRRLIAGLGVRTQPVVAEGAPGDGPASIPPALDHPASDGTASRHSADPREALVQRLQDAGFSAEEAQRALAAMRGEYEQTSSVPPRQAQAADQARVAERAAPGARTTRPNASGPRTTTPGVFGQSGLLRTPTADTLRAGQAAVSASAFEGGDVRTFGVSAGLGSGTEVTATVTSGDIRDAILLNAKQPVYTSADGR
ncbi:MAG: S-layer homology domain-containing protein [Armatimonadota bacterium]|jgi:hypothetical protein